MIFCFALFFVIIHLGTRISDSVLANTSSIFYFTQAHPQFWSQIGGLCAKAKPGKACLGFNRSLVLSSTSPVTLTLGGGGTKTLIVGSTGKKSISPFEHSVIAHLFHDLFLLPFPSPLPNFLTFFLISHAHDQ